MTAGIISFILIILGLIISSFASTEINGYLFTNTPLFIFSVSMAIIGVFGLALFVFINLDHILELFRI